MAVHELFDNVYIIEGTVGERPLRLPLLVGDDRTVLMDTGAASDVEGLIKPALAELNLAPDDLSILLITHPDFDHQGGNAALKRDAPNALLACSDADRPLIEDPEVIYDRRYDAYREKHDHYNDAETEDFIMEQLGAPQSVDLTFSGGEQIRLGDDWRVDVVSLPGHSRGHLGVLDRKHDALYGGDAIHGDVYLDTDGNAALPPTYLHVQQYLRTIQFVEHLDIDTYVGCHWSVKTGDEIAEFCRDSRLYVRRLNELLLGAVRGDGGNTLTELCHELGPQMGDWPEDVHADMCYAVAGHLRDLTARGVLRENDDVRPAQYHLAKKEA